MALTIIYWEIMILFLDAGMDIRHHSQTSTATWLLFILGNTVRMMAVVLPDDSRLQHGQSEPWHSLCDSQEFSTPDTNAYVSSLICHL